MKKKWMKKLSAALCAATMFASLSATAVFAVNDTPDANPDVFETEDYQDLMGVLEQENPPEYGSLTIEKKISDVYADDGTPTEEFEEGKLPVKGVQFTVTEVGHYATYVDGKNVAQVRIGIDVALANLIGISTDIQAGAVTAVNDGKTYVYLTSEDFNKINEKIVAALKDTTATGTTIKTFNETFASYSSRSVTTNGNGIGTINKLPFGIYLVQETGVSNAVTVETVDGKTVEEKVYFSEKQYPYVVSVPAWTKKDNDENWYVDIDARAKNATETVNIDKSIQRDANTVNKADEGKHKNDVTHIGDVVEFTLLADVPVLEDPINRNDKIESYEIHDNISAGLTVNGTMASGWIDEIDNDVNGNIYVVDGSGVEYNLTTEDKKTEGDYYITDYVDDDPKEEPLYQVGYTFTIKFTENGLAKLTGYAKNQEDLANGKYIKVNYSATVNANAVVGSAGNPNKVQLQYKAAGSSEISTSWHEVTEFIFTMDAKKTFDGSDATKDQAGAVKFELYLDKEGKRPVLLDEVSDSEADKGKYTYHGEGTDEATEIVLTDTGTFSIKGVPVTNENSKEPVTLYLKETATAPDYNKLTRLIPITLVPTKVNDEYDGSLADTSTVNDKAATLVADSTDKNSGISFTVNNTSGFQLPSTGGMGIWMFVIGGMAVIGCGLLYYRRNKSAE